MKKVMKKVWLFIITFLMFCSVSYGLDRKFDTTNTFEIRLIWDSGYPMTNASLATFGNLVFKGRCYDVYSTTETNFTVDETGDTLDTTDINRGIIRLTTNDTMPTCTECICTVFAEGQAATDLAGMIDSSSGIEFKAVTNVLSFTGNNANVQVKGSDATVGMNYADISVAASGSSFTIAAPTDFQGNAITMTTDFLKNRLLKAYTNGGAPCNVNGQGGWVNTVTSGGVVTLDTTTTGSGFTATPNTTNCGIMWSP